MLITLLNSICTSSVDPESSYVFVYSHLIGSAYSRLMMFLENHKRKVCILMDYSKSKYGLIANVTLFLIGLCLAFGVTKRNDEQTTEVIFRAFKPSPFSPVTHTFNVQS